MAHTLYEDRDLNSSKELFDDLPGIKIDPEMVQLATQLVQRQAGKYDAADLEDRYETRLRAMIDAKLKGEGIERERTGRTGPHECRRPDGGAEEEPRPREAGENAAPKRKKARAQRMHANRPASSCRSRAASRPRRKGRGSGDDQALAQAGLSRLPLCPAFDADQPSLLFEADDAVDIGRGDQVADFVVAKTTLGALEPYLRHPTLPHRRHSALSPSSGSAGSPIRRTCRKMHWIIVDEGKELEVRS